MSSTPNNQSDSLPVSDVIEMRKQGQDNNQIIQALQDQGYSSSDIFDALNQADMQEMEEEKQQQKQQAQAPSPSSHKRSNASQEELIEEIIEEKWHDLVDKLQVVIDWKEQSEQRLAEMEQEVKSLRDSVEQVQKSVGDRLEDYDGTMKDVRRDVQAMEKTFSDALPKFTENVSELRAVVEAVKSDGDSSANTD